MNTAILIDGVFFRKSFGVVQMEVLEEILPPHDLAT